MKKRSRAKKRTHGIDAAELAEFLGWSSKEMATYCGVRSTNLKRLSVTRKHQDTLVRLDATMRQLVELMNGSVAHARAWLRTPLWMLGGKSPKEEILGGGLARVHALLAAIEYHFVA